DDLGPSLREPALRAGGRVQGSLCQRPHPDSPIVGPIAGTPPSGPAERTPRRIASATARDAIASRSRWGAPTSPVATANTVSPSHIVCAGVTPRERHSVPCA